MSIQSVFENPSELINELRYPKERSRFVWAIIGLLPIAFILGLLIINTEGFALIFMGFYGVMIWFFLWFLGRVLKASLLMNTIEINNKNFKELNETISEAKALLDYKKNISGYVWQGSKVGLHVLHLLDRKVFLIESSFLEDSPSKLVLDFTVMFHIARLKTRSEYFSLITSIISGIEKLWFLNILLCPFERATVYTADRVAMLYCGEPTTAKLALAREMIGTELGLNIDCDAVTAQGLKAKGFFAWVARAYSPMPGYSHRFYQLDSFANIYSNSLLERHKP